MANRSDGVRADDQSAEGGGKGKYEQRDRKDGRLALYVGSWFVGLGFLLIFLFSLNFSKLQGVQLFAIYASLSGACLVGGGLLGFLFGFPRLGQAGGEERLLDPDNSDPETPGKLVGKKMQADASNGKHSPNTNLEEVSDWLTKIIIGVSLVQANDIANSVDTFSTQLGRSAAALISASNDVTGSSSTLATFSNLCILYFFVSGLYFGYLWTRLRLQNAIRQSDNFLFGDIMNSLNNIVEYKVGTAFDQQAQADEEAMEALDRLVSLESGNELNDVEKNEIRQAIASASLATRTEIYRRVREARRKCENENDRNAIGLLEPAIRGLIDADEQRSKKKSEKWPKYHKNFAELAYILAEKDDPNFEGAIEALNRAIKIRDSQFRFTDDIPGYLRLYELVRAKYRSQSEPGNVDEIHKDVEFVRSKQWGRTAIADAKNFPKNDVLREWLVSHGYTNLIDT